MSMASKRRSLKRSLPMIELEPTKKHAAERYVTPIATENSQFLPVISPILPYMGVYRGGRTSGGVSVYRGVSDSGWDCLRQ